jgi:uncharacterized membrane protein
VSLGRHLRKTLITGVLVLLPLVVTLWFLSILLDLVDATLGPLQWLATLVPTLSERHPVLVVWLARAIGVALILALIYLMGLFTAWVVGRRIVAWLEGWIRRVPLVGGIYGAFRQLLDALSRTGASGFTRCVLVEYPRRGVQTLAFVTRDEPHHLGEDGTEHVSVFVPTTPNPTSGFFLLVPREELVVLDLAVDEGIKLIVSGGMVTPGDLGSRRPGPAPPREGP